MMSLTKNISTGKLIASILIIAGFGLVYNSQSHSDYTFTTLAQENSQVEEQTETVQNPFKNNETEEDSSTLNESTDDSSAFNTSIDLPSDEEGPAQTHSASAETDTETAEISPDETEEITDSGPEMILYLAIPFLVAIFYRRRLFRS